MEKSIRDDLPMLLLLLSACGPLTVVLPDAEDAYIAPPEDSSGDETMSRDSADATADDSDAGSEPTPDFDVWNGSRRFSYDYSDFGYYCDETVHDTGTAVDSDSPAWRALAQACPTCTRFYELTPDRTQACDWIPLDTTWSGVRLDTSTPEVHLFQLTNDGGVAAREYADAGDAAFDGHNLSYGYEAPWGAYWSVEIDGSVVFPLASE
jgi:hypothetical protein